MALKRLQELLDKYRNGELTREQFEAELNKDLPEDWVPKHTFNEQAEKLKLAESQNKDANTQLEALKKEAGLSEERKKQIEELTEKQKADRAEFEKQLTDMRNGHALDSALTAAHAKNVKAVKALLDSKKLTYNEDGTITGLTEQLEALQKSDAYLFESANNNGGSGSGTGSDPAGGRMNFPSFGAPAGTGGNGGSGGADLLKAMASSAGVTFTEK